MNQDKNLEQLIQRYMDGCATADDIAQLNARLAEDAEARAWFIEWMNLDSALEASLVSLPDIQPDAAIAESKT